MDAVNIPSETVPPEMKTACEQTLKRAKELKRAEPVVAYWCCFSAAQKALKVPNRSGQGTQWLMTLLDALEQMKGILGTNEAVTNEAAGAAYIENFALKIFMSADNDDRNGNTGKATTRRFVVAGQFIEVLRCFENGMTEEMEQKLQYARWKAADGAKALREGRTPTSGPPLPESDLDLPSLPSGSPGAPSTQLSSPPNPPRGSFSSITRPTVTSGSPSGSTPTGLSPAPQGKVNLPNIDTTSHHDALRTPHRTQSSGSGAWSTMATPGLPDSEEEERRFDLNLPTTSTVESPSTPPGARSPSGEKKNVRFMGPDGAPLSPAQTNFTVDSYDAPDAPPPSSFAPSPITARPTDSFPPSFTDPNPVAPNAPNGYSREDSHATLNEGSNGNAGETRPRGYSNSQNNSRPSPKPNAGSLSIPPAPPPSLTSYPSQPPSVPQPHGLGLTSPPPSAPPAHSLPSSTAATVGVPPATANFVPTRKQVEQTQKHARWAISALDYDDVETAKLELRRALAVLGG